MVTNDNRALGEYGERLAARYLREHGYTLLDRNWRCPRGEIDIVARDGACLVVCEVKTRRNETYGQAVEAVHPRKATRLRLLAGCWREAHPHEPVRDMRVDVIGVLRPRVGVALLTHLKAVAS